MRPITASYLHDHVLDHVSRPQSVSGRDCPHPLLIANRTKRQSLAMPVFYSLVARGQLVLCDHAAAQGNLESVALHALEELNLGDTQRCLESGRYRVYVSVSRQLSYLCITDDEYPPGKAFQLLSNIEQALHREKLHERALRAGPYALRAEFGDHLAAEMNKQKGGVVRLQSKVQTVQRIMSEDMEKLIQRGEGLEDLVDRSDTLAVNSAEFSRTANKLRRKILLKSIKLWVVLGVILGVVVTIVVVLIVLGATHKL